MVGKLLKPGETATDYSEDATEKEFNTSAEESIILKKEL